jgi:hypothetical protein
MVVASALYVSKTVSGGYDFALAVIVCVPLIVPVFVIELDSRLPENAMALEIDDAAEKGALATLSDEPELSVAAPWQWRA